jgi:glycosyltransferase involved in cell wall biosynthesis
MSFLDKISVLILTYNEADNIRRTLDALSPFSDVVVLDSGSNDDTIKIFGDYSNVRYLTRPFDTHVGQWNHGLTSCGIRRPWILALDADYVLSPTLVDEIASLSPKTSLSGYRIAFRYCVCGRPLSAALYPPVTALYRRERAHYVQEGHTQRVVVDGAVGCLKGYIDHDDRKPLSRWLESQQRYTKLEADYLLGTSPARLRRVDKLRLMAWPSPILVFLYTLLAKGCILDGWPGWFYVLQRTLAETLIAMQLLDRRLNVSSVERAQENSAEPAPCRNRE